jgi:hypothetical protein
MSIPLPDLLQPWALQLAPQYPRTNQTAGPLSPPQLCRKKGRSKRLAKSPCSVNVNSLLAEINLPTDHFNNVLEALHPSTNPTDNGPNNPCDLTPPTNKNMQVTQLASPTGVDAMATVGLNAPVDNKPSQANKSPQHQTTPPSRSVQINKTATSVNHTVNTSGGVSQGRQSILLSTSNSTPLPPSQNPKEQIQLARTNQVRYVTTLRCSTKYSAMTG